MKYRMILQQYSGFCFCILPSQQLPRANERTHRRSSNVPLIIREAAVAKVTLAPGVTVRSARPLLTHRGRTPQPRPSASRQCGRQSPQGYSDGCGHWVGRAPRKLDLQQPGGGPPVPPRR